MTVGQLKRVLSVVPNEAEVKCQFKFSAFSSQYDAQIMSVTVNDIDKETSAITLNIEESEETKAVIADAVAA